MPLGTGACYRNQLYKHLPLSFPTQVPPKMARLRKSATRTQAVVKSAERSKRPHSKRKIAALKQCFDHSNTGTTALRKTFDGPTKPTTSSDDTVGPPLRRLKPQVASKKHMEVAIVPFSIIYPRPQGVARKRKRGGNAPELGNDQLEYLHETHEFDPRLSTNYHVQDRSGKGSTVQSWESIKSYGSFKPRPNTPSADVIRKGDLVFVHGNKGPRVVWSQDANEYDACWVAQVLDIRASDAAHVYCRIWWMYRPHETSGGRQLHHADGEVFPSNHMDIIDAATIEGKARIKAVANKVDLTTPYDVLLWRQTYNAFSRRILDEPEKICVCDNPANPDWGPIHCNGPAGCGEWMHRGCVEKDIEKRVHHQPPNEDKNSSTRLKLDSLKQMPMYLFNTLARRSLGPSVLEPTSIAEHTELSQSTKEPRQFKAVLVRPGRSTRPQQALCAAVQARDISSTHLEQETRTEQPGMFKEQVECLFCRQTILQQIGHAMLDPQLHDEDEDYISNDDNADNTVANTAKEDAGTQRRSKKQKRR